jgi:methylphosphotriester-DNA--protein-cysteine methyltransferase
MRGWRPVQRARPERARSACVISAILGTGEGLLDALGVAISVTRETFRSAVDLTPIPFVVG